MSEKKEISPKIIELFRNDLENHTQVLDSGLIELESDQTPGKVEPLMRAAHSIKGAARIVGLENAVELAHAMEDVLSLVMAGKLKLESASIDVLLKANDVFLKVVQKPGDDIYDIFNALDEEINVIKDALHSIAKGNTSKIPPLSFEKPVEDKIIKAKSKLAEADKKGKEISRGETSFVRVDSLQMNKILGLAGETLVQTRMFKPVFSDIRKIKFLMRELEHLVEIKVYNKGSDIEKQKEKMSELLDELSGLIDEHDLTLQQIDMKFESLTGKMYYETVATRMRPFSEGTQSYPRMVRDVAKQLNKKVKFAVSGERTSVDRDILEKLDAPLTHLIRNAIDHGIEFPDERVKAGKPEYGTILLDARHRSGMLIVAVSDDGRGIEPEEIRKKIVAKNMIDAGRAKELSDAELMDFLFLPGFTTADKVTELSGRGVGLNIVSSMVQEVGGTIRAESHPGKGTTFTLQLPLTLSLIRALIVNVNDEPYAIPLTKIDRVLELEGENVEELNGRKFFKYQEENIALIDAKEVLGIKAGDELTNNYPVIVVSDKFNKFGIKVDVFLSERNIVIHPLPEQLGKIPNINAASILNDGRPVLVLDVKDMIRRTSNLLKGQSAKEAEQLPENESRKKILVVEDSATVLESLRTTLYAAGFKVLTAVDGMDGWNILKQEEVDLVITDIDMPRMDGIKLVRMIKSNKKTENIPIIVQSYKDREEDRMEAEDAGAEMFISKSTLNEKELVALVKMLLNAQ